MSRILPCHNVEFRAMQVPWLPSMLGYYKENLKYNFMTHSVYSSFYFINTMSWIYNSQWIVPMEINFSIICMWISSFTVIYKCFIFLFFHSLLEIQFCCILTCSIFHLEKSFFLNFEIVYVKMSKIEVFNLSFIYLFKYLLIFLMTSKSLYQTTVDNTNSKLIYSLFFGCWWYLKDCFNIFNTFSNYLHQAPWRFLILDKLSFSAINFV